MEAQANEGITGMSALSPAQFALLEVLRPGVDERSVAREMSTTVAELRTMVVKLARDLNLPSQGDPAKEFYQLVQESDRLTKANAAATKRMGKELNGHGGLQLVAQWKHNLSTVAAAVAKGVLVSVDPYKIRPMHGQPREFFPEEEQGSLEESLGAVGQIQDLIIRKKPPPANRTTNAQCFESDERVWRIADTEYEICDGERRWRGSMSKKLLEVRAKLIEIDDEGAYLVACVSNFNRVGHTTLERARNIKRLMGGDSPFPIEIIAMMQGISVATARKLLDTLNLPPDIHALMNPTRQKGKGEDVLGKMPSYELARLAGNPVLHEHARDLANRYVRRELKLPQMRDEVDRILARSGTSRDVIAERNQPARRLRLAEGRLTVAIDAMRDVLGRLKDLKTENVLLERSIGLGPDLNSIVDMAEEALGIVGSERKSKNK